MGQIVMALCAGGCGIPLPPFARVQRCRSCAIKARAESLDKRRANQAREIDQLLAALTLASRVHRKGARFPADARKQTRRAAARLFAIFSELEKEASANV